MIPYHWQYLPLFLQILAAFGLGAVMVTASWFIGRHRNTPTKLAAYECGIEAVGDARQRFTDAHADFPADSLIHFIKHQRRHVVLSREDHLQCQHQAR